MTVANTVQHTAVEKYRALHQTGCFVLPNPWDAGSAMALERLGFVAVATTSAGFAFTLGLPDEVVAIPLDAMLEHCRALAAVTRLPVNADFQNGYADQPENLATNVARCVATGVAGLSIEDSTGRESDPLYDRALAIERVRAARRAIDDSGVPVVLTARCEAWLVRHPEPLATSLDRLVAFAEAGADCLYAPGVQDPREIAEIVRAVAPKPVNVLVSGPGPGLTLAELAKLGVRRISVGSALSRVAWGAFLKSAREIASTGRFDSLAGAEPFEKLNGLFRR